MMRIEQRLAAVEPSPPADAMLTLPFEMRCRSRLLLRLDDGEEAGLFLERGTVLNDGDRLLGSDGRIVQVIASAEAVYCVRPSAQCSLARAAYHLGNRHIPVQIGIDFLRIERDAVLRDMLVLAGADVVEEFAPFQPEPGAYGGGHRHGHDEGFVEEHALVRSVFVARHGGGVS